MFHPVVHHAFARADCNHAANMLADQQSPSSQAGEQQPTEKSLKKQPNRIAQLWLWTQGLNWQKKVYVALVTLITVWLVPKLFSFGLVGVERMIMGALIAVEGVIVLAFQSLAAYGVSAGVLVLIGYGVYAFFIAQDKR